MTIHCISKRLSLGALKFYFVSFYEANGAALISSSYC